MNSLKYVCLLLMATLAGMISCKKISSRIIVAAGPQTVWVSGGDSTHFSVFVNSKNTIKSIEVWQYIDDGAPSTIALYNLTAKALNTYSYQQGYMVPTGISGATIRIVFIVTDHEGITQTAGTIIHVAPRNALSSARTVYLSNQNFNGGLSFFAVRGLTSRSQSDASSMSDQIDLLHFYSDTNEASIAAPSNTAAQHIFPSIKSWPTKNRTGFVKAPPSFDYKNATYASVKANYDASGASDIAAHLRSGDILLFKIAANHYGVFIVDEITGNYMRSGTIIIDLKLEQ